MAGASSSRTTKAVGPKGLDRLRATLALDEPATSVRLVSSARAQALARAFGVQTVRDLLAVYPTRYVDMSQVVSVQQAQIGSQVTLVGRIHEIKKKMPRPRLTIVEIALVDDTGLIMITCFNQPWLMDSLAPGMELSVSGTVEFSYGFKRMTNPFMEPRAGDEAARGLVLSVHPATAKVSRAMMRRLTANAVDAVRGLYDPLPLRLRERYRLYSRFQALRGVHQPVSVEDAEQARRRLRYEELFFLELELVGREHERAASCEPYRHVAEGEATGALRAALPFDLTDDQRAAVEDIQGRMADAHPMNHLLLGDVGTGKTLVATFALAVAAQSGYQAMMMGPTEVLARQYGVSAGVLLDGIGVSWALLTGSTPPSERARIVEDFASGSLQVLFGTHALLEGDVAPKACSLVCIDEQQRFGVEQRDALVAKAPGADVLSMTATPIPRSLALARYGGMTLSYLRQAPARQGGRVTEVCHFSEEGRAYDALREAIAAGEQAYVICPLIGVKPEEGGERSKDAANDGESVVEYAMVEWGIEHDEVGDTLSAATMHAAVLQDQIVPQARVALLHGRMPSREKDEVMERFRAGEIDVLVSTTVVEVGVDVPNATVMIIEDADRFGLSQLHQLRGRVGRGDKPGRVFLVSRSRAPEALERLAAMERTDDGFALAEQDLAMRREGDVLGDRQHGASPLKLVNVMRDAAVIEAAYQDARACWEGEGITSDEHAVLMRELAAVKKARKR